MLPIQRQLKIKEFLVERGFTSVEELSKQFEVSEMTIRRDLDELHEQGIIQRIYGGAMDNDQAFFEMSVNAKSEKFAAEKIKIGRAGADLVQNGDTVFMDSGTTTLEVAKNLKGKKITIITTALNVAVELSVSPDIDILVAGGILRKGPLNTTGPQTDTFIRELRVDKVFIGVEGVDLESGISVPDPINAHNKQSMLEIARQVIVVADHSKLGRTTTSTIAPLDRVHVVITDNGADPVIVEELRQKTQVILV
jgi:DeoR family fructose operon transcriptional repressor